VKGDYGVDEGIQSSPKDQARFFALSAPFDSEFNNVGKDLVLSYTVKHEQNLQCGGAYIKLLKKGALKQPLFFAGLFSLV
jgi:calreticulin